MGVGVLSSQEAAVAVDPTNEISILAKAIVMLLGGFQVLVPPPVVVVADA